MTLVVLVDTNVVVSGVLAGEVDSPNARILDGMLSGALHFISSDDLLAEYRTVLLRPAIVARHQLKEANVDALLEGIIVNAGCGRRSPPGGQCSPRLSSRRRGSLRRAEHRGLRAQP